MLVGWLNAAANKLLIKKNYILIKDYLDMGLFQKQ